MLDTTCEKSTMGEHGDAENEPDNEIYERVVMDAACNTSPYSGLPRMEPLALRRGAYCIPNAGLFTHSVV